MRKRALAATIVLIAISVVTDQGQSVPPPQVFRSNIDLVHFDVSVLDRARRPVRGLTAGDFTVLEDGKVQPITAFAAIEVSDSPLPRPTWTHTASRDVTNNEEQLKPEGRLFVLVLDDALLPADPAALQNAKSIARGIVDRLSPVDQAAVVFTFASREAQNFTADRAKLHKAIDSLRGGAASHVLGWDVVVRRDARNPQSPDVPGTDPDIGLRLGSMRTLQFVADALIAAPQRRKSLILISPGITVDSASAAEPVKAGNDPGAHIREANYQLTRELPELYRRLNHGNVPIYSFDPCGLGGLEGYVLRVAGSLPSLRNGTDPPGLFNWLNPTVAPRPVALARHKASVDLDFLIGAAANTGGRATVNTNDFESGLNDVFGENASYYLLGYAAPPRNVKGSFHRVAVNVKRANVTVRARNWYYTEGTHSAAAHGSAETLAAVAASPIAGGPLRLEASIAPVGTHSPEDTKEYLITVVLGLRQPPALERRQETIDLQTAVFTPDGRPVKTPLRQTARFQVVPRDGASLQYDVLTKIALAPGRYEVRVAARRASDGLAGSVYVDVNVPNFSSDPLSISGIWLEASSFPNQIPRDALVSILPLAPTSSREFAATDNVVAFFRAYQGGTSSLQPVSLQVRLVDDKDSVLAHATGQIETRRFDSSTRAADHRFELPLRELKPGQYLLTFELELAGRRVSRDVVFIVR